MTEASEHPLGTIVSAAVLGGYDFLVVLGGDRELRLKMGLPRSVADREPLLLTFPAEWHGYSKPTADTAGMSCVLSFDALYECRFPWSCVVQLVVQHHTTAEWPQEWGTAGTTLGEASTTEPTEALTEEPPSNVRQFRPRPRRS